MFPLILTKRLLHVKVNLTVLRRLTQQVTAAYFTLNDNDTSSKTIFHLPQGCSKMYLALNVLQKRYNVGLR